MHNQDYTCEELGMQGKSWQLVPVRYEFGPVKRKERAMFNPYEHVLSG